MWSPREGKKYWEVPPIMCELAASYKQKTYCKTQDEFDAFVASYMEE
jgi:hypothetical protein